jgi:hypothetical protein
MYWLKTKPPEQLRQGCDGELPFPTTEPQPQCDEYVFHYGIKMEGLRNINDQNTVPPENPVIFPKKRNRCCEVFQESLMENNVKRRILERTIPRITQDQFHLIISHEAAHKAQTLFRVIQERYVPSECLHLETITAGAGADFKNILSGNTRDAFRFFDYFCYGCIYCVWMLTGPELIPDLPFAVGRCYP